MLDNPLVSVIIPFHNNEQTIKRAIDSVLSQTYKNIEVIAIDDCSSDKSYEIVDAIDDPRIVLLKNKTNLKAGMTRNVGLDTAKGDYVAFLDADDAYRKDKIELDLLLFNNKKEIDVIGNRICSMALYGTEIKNEPFEYNIISIQSILKRNTMLTSSVIMKNTVKEKFPKDFDIAEDLYFWCLILSANHIVAVTNRQTTFYNNSYNNRMSLNFKKQYKSERFITNLMYKNGKISKKEKMFFKVLYFLKFLRRPIKFKYLAHKEKKLQMKLEGKNKAKYDYLIVGAGLFGATCAYELTKKGYKVLVIDKREYVGGNTYTENIDGINVHKYGAHIFHTNDERVWEFVNKFGKFNNYINSPKANYKGEIYSLPFNMNTFHEMWGVNTVEEAQTIIEKQRKEIKTEPTNLEEQAISLVGRDIYEKLIKGYTEKQWGRDCKELPSFIIKRLPVRFIYDNNYFNSKYQGIPIGGYTSLVNNMLKEIDVRLSFNFLEHKEECLRLADKIIYTGPIDEYFDYRLGTLEYRSVSFKSKLLDMKSFQNNAVINYTDRETPYTRIIEHKWFEFGKDANGNDLPKTYISEEYSCEWKKGDEPFYPVNNQKNADLYVKYAKLAEKEDVIFGGRLAEYKYYDMDQVIASALSRMDLVEKKNG